MVAHSEAGVGASRLEEIAEREEQRKVNAKAS